MSATELEMVPTNGAPLLRIHRIFILPDRALSNLGKEFAAVGLNALPSKQRDEIMRRYDISEADSFGVVAAVKKKDLRKAGILLPN